MLILAKKKDYYDGVTGTVGVDKTIVYDRQLIEIEDKDIPNFLAGFKFWKKKEESPFYKLEYHHLTKEAQKTYCDYTWFIIGFCGKLYVGWKLYKLKKFCDDYDNIDTIITYDFEQVKKLVEPRTWGGLYFEDAVIGIKQYNAIEMFREFNAPIFVYDHDYGRTHYDNKYYLSYRHISHFIINCTLKDYEFYKLFPTFQAFQEIQMFLSGVLGNKEKEIVVIDDKYKIEQHGFDKKWSFRKEPEKK